GGGGSPAARARAVSAANTAVFGKQAPFAHRPSGARSASSRAPQPSCSTRARSAATAVFGASRRSRSTCQRIAGSPRISHCTTGSSPAIGAVRGRYGPWLSIGSIPEPSLTPTSTLRKVAHRQDERYRASGPVATGPGRDSLHMKHSHAAGRGANTPGAAVPASLLTRLWRWLDGSEGRSGH